MTFYLTRMFRSSIRFYSNAKCYETIKLERITGQGQLTQGTRPRQTISHNFFIIIFSLTLGMRLAANQVTFKSDYKKQTQTNVQLRNLRSKANKVARKLASMSASLKNFICLQTQMFPRITWKWKV